MGFAPAANRDEVVAAAGAAVLLDQDAQQFRVFRQLRVRKAQQHNVPVAVGQAFVDLDIAHAHPAGGARSWHHSTTE